MLCRSTGGWQWDERALLPADPGGTDLSDLETGEPALGERL